MFSLIITIISIALVAAIAVATLYYGGSQFSQGTAKANADQLISAAQQIAGANTLYANNFGGNYDTTVSDLQTQGYLNAIPTVSTSVSTGAFTLAGANSNTVTLPLVAGATAVCAAVEKQSGAISASATVPSATQVAGRQYDCFGSGTYTFTFKG
jgi:predicted PurR-regulated permease PerM